MLDPNNPTLVELNYALATFSGPLTRRITDYLHGYQLGPRTDVPGFAGCWRTYPFRHRSGHYR